MSTRSSPIRFPRRARNSARTAQEYNYPSGMKWWKTTFLVLMATLTNPERLWRLLLTASVRICRPRAGRQRTILHRAGPQQPRSRTSTRYTDPIDVVYTWVDGDDPVWQQRKNDALGITDTAQLNDTAVNASRFISRNELLYSLRSIELYANWVRNIYIVTDHQVPDWLDTANPRIKIVSHEDIFTDPDVLPVFNSHAIESQLHHIDGLSNKFLDLNDDVFFGGIVQPGDFFHSSRISKYFPSNACLDVAPASARDLPVLSAAKNARALIADEFGVTITNKFKHTPIALQRDVLYEMEERFPDLFKTVAASRFRHPDDYSIPSGLYHFYAFATGRAVPGHIKYGYQDISQENLPVFLARIVQNNPYRVFCLNDTATTPDQLELISLEVSKAMARCYPFKSEFEIWKDRRR